MAIQVFWALHLAHRRFSLGFALVFQLSMRFLFQAFVKLLLFAAQERERENFNPIHLL